MQGARDRTRQYNLPAMNIKPKWIYSILQKGVCQATGLPFRWIKGKRNIWSATLDRAVPSEGYREGNVRIVCHGYNVFKLDFDEVTFGTLLQQCLLAYGYSPDIRYELPKFEQPEDPEWDCYRVCQIYGSIRFRSRKKGEPDPISNAEFKYNLLGKCPVTNIDFDISSYLLKNNLSSNPKVNKYLAKGRKVTQPWAPSLHRINVNGGYNEENVCMVSHAFNIVRGDYSRKDFVTLIQRMGQLYGFNPLPRDKKKRFPYLYFKEMPGIKIPSKEEREEAIENALNMLDNVDFSEFENSIYDNGKSITIPSFSQLER